MTMKQVIDAKEAPVTDIIFYAGETPSSEEINSSLKMSVFITLALICAYCGITLAVRRQDQMEGHDV